MMPVAYSERNQRFKMQYLAEVVNAKAVNYGRALEANLVMGSP